MIRDGSQFSSIKKRMVYCRNLMVKVLDDGYDYFLMLIRMFLSKDALRS